MNRFFCYYFRIGLIALVFIGLSGLARAQGTYYDGPTTLVDMRPYGFSYSAYAHDTRLWIPNDVTVIRGVIILGNGAGGDQRGRTEETDWQALARAHGFALMGTRGYVCYRSTALVDEEVRILLNDFAGYATASGHPEVAHLPFVLAGWSGGGQMANGINARIPERVIAFIANKGTHYLAPSSAASLKTPSILVAGQLDGQANRDGITNLFRNNRPSGALWANAFEQNTAHNEGNVDGVFFTFFDHAIRARYPAGATPLSGPVTLLDLTESNGWLATEPTVSSGLSGSVYPYATYSGDKTTACWLMDADVANLYRGFATYNPAVTVTPVGGPLFSASQMIEFRVSVDSAAFPEWTSADVYDGAFKLGTVNKGGAMSVYAVRPWGGRGVTAIARDASNNERTSIPQPFVVNRNSSPAWNNSSGNFFWDTTSANWGGAVWTPGVDAVFGATGVGTVTVSGTQSVGTGSSTALTFNTAGYTLTGGTLGLPSVSGNISTFAVNADAAISSAINAGAGAVKITSTGTSTSTLTLSPSGPSTAGGLHIVSGAVNLTSGNFNVTGSGWQNASQGLWLNGGNLNVAGGALSTTGSVINENGTLTVSSGTYTSNGSLINAWGGTATTTVSGGLLDINGDLRVSQGTGTVNLDGGTVKLRVFQCGNGVATGTVNFNGATVVARESAVGFTQTYNTTYNVKSGGVIFDTAGFNITAAADLLAGSPSGGLTKNGAGTLTLSGNSTYTGATTINAGTLSVSTDANLGSGGGITINGGTLQTTGSSAFSSSKAILAGNFTIEASNAAGTTLTGVLTGGGLRKTGNGSLTFSSGTGNTDTLTGLNIVSGAVNLTSGNFNVTGSGVQNATQGLWLDGGNLNVAGGALSTTGTVGLQNGTLTVSSGTYTSSGTLLNAYGGTATTTVSGGLLDIAGALRVSQGTGTVNLDGGTIKLVKFESAGSTGTVNFNGAAVQAKGDNISFTDTANTTYNVKSGGAIFDTAGSNITAGADLLAGSPSGGLTKNGAGTLTLSGNSTYTGATTVNAGTLQLDGSIIGNLTVQADGRLIGSGTIGGDLTVASGGVAEFSGGIFVVNGDITNNGLVILSNGARISGTSSSFVNNGTLDVITAGTFTPPPGFQNNGVLLDSSAVRVASVSRSGNNVTVRINSNTGHTYRLQYSPTLSGGSFENIGSPQTGSTGTVLEFTHSSSAGSGFYRVTVNP